MILNIKVVPKSSRNLVKEESNNLKVYLTKPAYGGLANEQLISSLANYFKVKKYQVKIIKGERSRDKLVEISNG
ncbi:MAG: DUF167 domain-containing protein [Candidatus Omnitrophica bacterium]|nr:DUF167 domain-containing protein [Candidatus Omnitrophota bacterium]MBU1928425.1 DUF167 domain-containing protein [Candidatus Omnitrophota bacterium]MBU2034307.1 DUF167 domain-containing protein [Candidatus Omnitrophota bacterium]MBU2258253.1 DUF167 domain-containing protein [Candidatus Omnitrophota bacterium]